MSTRRMLAWAFLACVWTPAPAWAQTDVVAYLPGMLLGRGYDDTTGSIKADCLAFNTESIPSTGVGLVTYTLTEVTSSQDLFQLTSVDASASVNVGLFSASAEMALLSQSQINNFNASFLAWVSVERGWDYTKDSAFRPEYATMAQNNAEQFEQNCGNRFVAGILSGGEFYGLITVQTSSQSDRTEVSAAVQASYGPFSGQAGFSQQTRQELQAHQSSISGYKTGSTATSIPLSIDQMQTQAANFPNDVAATGGAPIRVLLVDYPGLQPAPLGSLLNQLASLRWDYATAAREVRYVLDHPGQFYMTIATWRTFLQSLRTEAETAVTKVGEAMAACGTGAAGCQVPAGLRTPDQIRGDLPPRYVGRCGATNFPARSMSVYPLGHRCGGDREMAGHNPSIRVNASLIPTFDGHVINARTYVKMTEGQSDWTCFDQTSEVTLWNLVIDHPGCYLRAAADATPGSGSLSARGGNDNHNFTWYSGTGLIDSANCRSDTRGNDDGRLGCSPVKFRPFQANLTHEEQRMGPNDLQNSAALSWRNKLALAPLLKLLEGRAVVRLNQGLEQVEARTGEKRTVEPPARPAPKPVRPALKVVVPRGTPIIIP